MTDPTPVGVCPTMLDENCRTGRRVQARRETPVRLGDGGGHCRLAGHHRIVVKEIMIVLSLTLATEN